MSHSPMPPRRLKELRCSSTVSYTHLDVYKRQEYGDYRGRDFRLKYAERDVRDLSIEMLRECLLLLLNCDLSIKLSGGENMDRIALEKLFAQLLYVAHRGSVA